MRGDLPPLPLQLGERRGRGGEVDGNDAYLIRLCRKRMTTKEQIHQLVDDLPERELETVKRVLEGLSALSPSNPVLDALANAPVDDEEVSDEEAQAIEDGERDIESGQVVSGDQVRTRLGL